ncbi:hypothetical protein F5Y08DRAFT_244498 [Xylaria arbuscula]|nr:hypothetical protein F5Y08DRAFT_244498 [Xylaria arbuscula]
MNRQLASISHSKQPRKRGRYSYLKCSSCRKDKQKCTPEVRPTGQKCDRCQNKKLDCSESKTAESSRCDLRNHAVSKSISEDLLFQDFVLLLSWNRMFSLVESVATRIKNHMRRGERFTFGKRNESIYINMLSNAVTYNFSNLIQDLSEEKDNIKRQTISLALQAQIQEHPTAWCDLLIDQLHEFENEQIPVVDETDRRPSTLECMINIVHGPRWNWPHTTKASVDLVAERYVQTWNELRERFIDMCYRRGSSLGALTSRFPFVHDLWLGQTGGLYGFLRSLRKADKNSSLEQDALGRTALHFHLDSAAELYRSNQPVKLELEDFQDLSVDATDTFGRTPLHIACASDKQQPLHSQLPNIEWLLERNANIQLLDVWGMRAIDYAIIDHREDILRLFKRIRGVPIDDILVKIQQAREAIRHAMSLS